MGGLTKSGWMDHPAPLNHEGPTARRPPASRRRLLRRLMLMLFVGAPLGLVGGEVVVRGLLRIKGTPYSAEATRVHLAELRSRVADALPMPGRRAAEPREDRQAPTPVPHPFLGFDDQQSVDATQWQLKRYARRDPERYVIMVLGGSVAGVFCARGGSDRLTELLAASPLFDGRRLEVINYGRAAHKQPQQIIRLIYALGSGIRADAVLSIDGFNEVAHGNRNSTYGMHPVYPAYLHWIRFVSSPSEDLPMLEAFIEAQRQRRELIDRIDSKLDADLFASALWGYLVRSGVARQQGRFQEARSAYERKLHDMNREDCVLGPGFSEGPENVAQTCVQTWYECSRQIQSLCEFYGMDYLHVLQPTLHDSGAKRMTEEEVAKGAIDPHWLEGVEVGYPLLRAYGQALGEGGIHFLDASRLFEGVEETLYFDACHFGEAGNRLLAEAIAPVLLEMAAEER